MFVASAPVRVYGFETDVAFVGSPLMDAPAVGADEFSLNSIAYIFRFFYSKKRLYPVLYQSASTNSKTKLVLLTH